MADTDGEEGEEENESIKNLGVGCRFLVDLELSCVQVLRRRSKWEERTSWIWSRHFLQRWQLRRTVSEWETAWNRNLPIYQSSQLHRYVQFICDRWFDCLPSGDYVENKRHSRGIFVYPDGSKYEGDWHENLRHGHGIYTYPNKDIYEGQWSNHRRHGKGTYKSATTSRSASLIYKHHLEILFVVDVQYVGMWKEGQRHGPGELHYGQYRYVGKFHENDVCRHCSLRCPGEKRLTVLGLIVRGRGKCQCRDRLTSPIRILAKRKGKICLQQRLRTTRIVLVEKNGSDPMPVDSSRSRSQWRSETNGESSNLFLIGTTRQIPSRHTSWTECHSRSGWRDFIDILGVCVWNSPPSHIWKNIQLNGKRERNWTN